MKIRDSGMPDEEIWAGFFDPSQVLARLGFAGGFDVVDFGCGYGTFSLAAAVQTTGTIHALDIDSAMVRATAERAAAAGLSNVRGTRCDFVGAGSGLPDGSVDFAMLFNILHAEEPVRLLREARRVLRSGGVVAVIHWIHDAGTPRGPALSIRPRPEQCAAWLREAEFEIVQSLVALPPYHYGLTGRRAD